MSKIAAVDMDLDSLNRRNSIIPILIIGVLFFIIGFVSWVNSILIPYFKIACRLTNFQSYLVTFAFYIAYFLMSVPASFLLKVKKDRGKVDAISAATISSRAFCEGVQKAYDLYMENFAKSVTPVIGNADSVIVKGGQHE